MTDRAVTKAALEPWVTNMAGPVALPRTNGELLFEAPWQGRVLAMAIGVVASLELEWDAFRLHLIAAIAEATDRPYYDSWLAALEALLAEHGINTPNHRISHG